MIIIFFKSKTYQWMGVGGMQTLNNTFRDGWKHGQGGGNTYLFKTKLHHFFMKYPKSVDKHFFFAFKPRMEDINNTLNDRYNHNSQTLFKTQNIEMIKVLHRNIQKSGTCRGFGGSTVVWWFGTKSIRENQVKPDNEQHFGDKILNNCLWWKGVEGKRCQVRFGNKKCFLGGRGI